jgi:hypothetical protein
MKTFELLLLLLFIGVMFSCKKSDTDSTPPPGSNDCDDHVLKEPYIVFAGDPTGLAVMFQTTSYAHDWGTVKIRWGYNDPDNMGDYHPMDAYKCKVSEGHEDYYIWRKSWGHGTFNPNSKVCYRVHLAFAHKDYWFDGFFYTSDDNMTSLSFYAFGDTRDGGVEFASVMGAMAYDMDVNYDKRYRLIIHTGDIVFNGPWHTYYPSSQNWNTHFFGRQCNNNGGDRDKALWILRRVPVMTTLGNHDFVWDGHSDKNSARFYLTNWPYWMYTYTNQYTLQDICDNQDFVPNERLIYYSFNYGPAHFISLSTYPAYEDQSQSFDTTGFLNSQYLWLKNDLINNAKSWTFVFCHIPFYDGGGAYNRTAIKSCEPLFQKYGVDAVLQGHQHCYVRINVDKGTPNEIPYITLGGGGVAPEPNAHSLADCYAEKYHFARFDITNNDSAQVFITEKHLHIEGNIEKFYIKNRPKQQ